MSFPRNNTPSNYGYIHRGNKYFGFASPTDEQVVKLIDRDNKELLVWTPRYFTKYRLRRDEISGKGWETDEHRDVIVRREMHPCPNESGDGVCNDRFNREHVAKFYHYSLMDNNGYVHFEGTYPVCKYGSRCWNGCNQHGSEFKH